jgi:hypothetical protein
MFANYQAFRLGFLRLADGDDISQSTFSTETADLIIALGERRVYRDLRASTMVSPLSLAPVSSVYTLPDDLIELKDLYFSGYAPIEIVPLDKLRKLRANGTSTGQVHYAAQNGDKLEFWPTTTSTVLGSYYALPDAMKDVTWPESVPTVTRYPDCFLYAALSESAEFLGMAQRKQEWERQYMQRIDAAHADEQRRVWGGSPLRIRAR